MVTGLGDLYLFIYLLLAMKIAVCPCVPTVNLNHHMVDKNENVRTFFFF